MSKVSLGIDYPIRKGGSYFASTYNTLDNVKAKINVLLRTMPKERPFNPEFGIGLYRFVFEQITQEKIDLLQSEIEQKIAKYIPEVNINNLEINKDFNDDTDNNRIKININYSMKNNPDISDQIVIEANK